MSMFDFPTGSAPVNDYCTVTFTNFAQDPHGVHEASTYQIRCASSLDPVMVTVLRDLTSDVRSYEGADAKRYSINGEDYTAAQVVRLAAPMSLYESRIVDSLYVSSKRSYLGPQAWAELLSMQGPMGTTVKRKYALNKDPSLSLDASDWINVTPSDTDTNNNR